MSFERANEVHRMRAAMFADLCRYEPQLPPLYPALANPDEPFDAAAYSRQAQALAPGVDADTMSTQLRDTGLRLSSAEQTRLALTATVACGQLAAATTFAETYQARFPDKRPKQVEQFAAKVERMSRLLTFHSLLNMSLAPRVVAHQAFVPQRRAIIRQVVGPQRQNLLDTGSTVSAGVLRDLELALQPVLFYELPLADLSRLPPSWQQATAREVAGQAIAFGDLLIRHSVSYLGANADLWRRAAKARMTRPGAVQTLEQLIEAHPNSSAGWLTDMFMIEGPEKAAAEAAQQDADRRRLSIAAIQRRKEQTPPTTIDRTQRVARLNKDQEAAADRALQELLADPEVRPEVTRLTPGAVLHLSPEGETVDKPTMERLIEKHLRAFAYTLRRQALEPGELQHPYPIDFDGAFNDDAVNVGELLTKDFYGRRENIWMAALPIDMDYVTKHFRRGAQRIDPNHLARFCIAVDLRSSGRSPVTNMVDVAMCVRQLARVEQSVISYMLRTPTRGRQGSDYLRLESSLIGGTLLHNQLVKIRLGGLPGHGKKTRH